MVYLLRVGRLGDDADLGSQLLPHQVVVDRTGEEQRGNGGQVGGRTTV